MQEQAFWSSGCSRVAGVDEVGRGPLAGPVTAAAVVLPRTPAGNPVDLPWIGELRDSKQISAVARESLAAIILRECEWGIASVSAQVVDQINIRQATRLAMWRAVQALPAPPQAVIIDGNEYIDGGAEQRAIPGADAACVSVAAASIIAKVARDRIMCDLDERFPGYGFAANKGYGTRAHRAALVTLGYTNIHRLSFAPVRQVVQL